MKESAPATDQIKCDSGWSKKVRQRLIKETAPVADQRNYPGQ
jgi:hypothetical protein